MMKKIIILCTLCASAFSSFSQQITLEDIWQKGTFNAKGVSGFNSMKDGRFYTAQDKADNIIRYTFANGQIVDTIIKKADINVNGFSYSFSDDEQKVLLQNNFKQIYRHSFSANIYVFDVKTKTITQPLTEQVMLAEFSPDGKKLVFSSNRNNGGTRDTNLFYAEWVD